MFGLSISHLLILLVIVLLVVGTKRLTSGAKDLGSAIKEFKKAVRDDGDSKPAESKVTDPLQPAVDPAKLPPADTTNVVAPGDDPRPRG